MQVPVALILCCFYYLRDGHEVPKGCFNNGKDSSVLTS